MQIQTRSYSGELRNFNTLREALDYSKSLNDVVRSLDDLTPPTMEQANACVWKISFSVGNERVRLVRNGGEWVLQQMDEEIERLMEEQKKQTTD
jgi:hypothetical protein